MRYVALLVILATLPFFIGQLQQPRARIWAFRAIGLMLFLDGLHIEANFIAWPLWKGIAKGLPISLIDTLAVALIYTRRKAGVKLPFWGLLSFYGAAIALSVVISAVPMASFFYLWQYGRMLLLFGAVAGECANRTNREALTAGLAAGLIVELFVVAQQKATGMVQATGTAVHQNTLGMMVEIAVILLLSSLLAGDRRKITLFGVLSGIVVIAAGGSRATIALAGGAAMILILLSLIRDATPVKGKVVGLAVLAMALALPVGMITLKDRFGNRAMIAEDTERLAFERAARAMAADHPFGVGANVYVSTANTKGYADRAGVGWNFANRSASVHNAYLLARAETGWWGEIGLIALLVLPSLRGLRFAFANRRSLGGEIALGASVALGCNVVHNNYEFAGLTSNVLPLIFISLALIAGEMRAKRLGRPAPRRAAAQDDLASRKGRPGWPAMALD